MLLALFIVLLMHLLLGLESVSFFYWRLPLFFLYQIVRAGPGGARILGPDKNPRVSWAGRIRAAAASAWRPRLVLTQYWCPGDLGAGSLQSVSHYPRPHEV